MSLRVRLASALIALARAISPASADRGEADEAKRDFISSVTHELRSPLGAIESFLVLIEAKLEGPNADQCREYIGRIHSNVGRLSRFIGDLLDAAKAEKGQLDCALRPMSLEAVASEVLESFRPRAREHGVTLSSALEGIPPVSGDPERLKQVLSSLLGNALKFTPGGGAVSLSAERAGGFVEVTVRDSGQGMGREDLDKLFGAFAQGRNVAHRSVGPRGTGLGLYISKAIIEKHGGTIGVKSEPGRGTAVSFSVRAA